MRGSTARFLRNIAKARAHPTQPPVNYDISYHNKTFMVASGDGFRPVTLRLSQVRLASCIRQNYQVLKKAWNVGG